MYSDPSFTIADMVAFEATRTINATYFDVCIAANDLDLNDFDTDDYHQWVLRWKQEYNHLSRMIHLAKKQRAQTPHDGSVEDLVCSLILNALRRLANTMLNARIFTKGKRRIYRNQRFVH